MTNVYPIKCRIRNDGEVTRIEVFDDIGEGGWFSEGLTAKDFTAQLGRVKGAIDVHINSAGGDVFDGIAIGNAIRDHKGRTRGVVDGIAASIASVIFQACQDREVQDGAMVMIHDAFGTCVGDAAEMAKMAETLDGVSDNIAGIYARRTGKDAAFWRAEMKQERWYTADQAVAAGLADRKSGDGAVLPAGLDLAAFSSVPGRIAARLRKLPQAAAGTHAPMTTDGHVHSHADGEGGTHSHEHSHDGDADHADHPHGDGMTDRLRDYLLRNGQQSCAEMGHQCCRDAGATMDELRTLLAQFKAAVPMHGDHPAYDPDGDGDNDCCPEGDTDHDHWAEDGTQLKPVPGRPMGHAYARFLNEKYSQDDRDRMAKSGQAMPDGSYPIADEEDLDNAIHAVGRGGSDHDAIRRHIIKRAKALGASERIPDNWNADGSADGGASDHEDLTITDEDLEQIRAALRGATA